MSPTALPPFDRLVRRHRAAMLRVAVAVCGPTDGEDALQDALISALRAYPDLDPDADARAWLLRIVHNRAVDHVRRGRRRPAALGEVEVAASPEPDPRPDLWARVAALPAKQRTAVALRYVADLSHREIGDLMDVTEAAARRSVHDGLAALRGEVER